MAPDNLLKTPKYLLALDAARALTVLTYVRTDEPQAVPAAYDDIMPWRIFATTGHDDLFPPVLPGDLPTKNESEDVRQAKVQKLNARRYRQLLYKATPEAVVDFLMNHDPKDEQAMGVVQIADASTIRGLSERLQKFYTKRFDDVRWIAMLIFTGTLPAKQAIPESLWDLFYPIDLIDEHKTEGQDTRVRTGLPSPEEHLAHFQECCGYLDDRYLKGASDPKLLEGMTLPEARESMMLSIVNTRKDPTNPKVMIDPPTIDAYKNRWARIA